jgi:prevent-host-death family protein
MTSIPIEDAQARLGEIIAQLLPGEEIEITKDNQPVARLVGEAAPSREPRKPGSAIGEIFIVSDDDEHLKDFADYMR